MASNGSCCIAGNFDRGLNLMNDGQGCLHQNNPVNINTFTSAKFVRFS